MPLIKEVFFKNKQKAITFLTKDEMLEKANSWLSESDKKDIVKKEKALFKNLNWFQKFNLNNKEFFVEKSENPLKIKNQLVNNETPNESLPLILGVSLIPVCVLPVSIYAILKNNINKQKVEENKPVYLEQINTHLGFYTVLFLLMNFITIVGLIVAKLGILYLTLFTLNTLFAYALNLKNSYMNIENYELMDFKLENDEFKEVNGIEEKIQNMQAKEIVVENKKIEYDFLQEFDLSKEERSKNPFDEKKSSFKQKL